MLYVAMMTLQSSKDKVFKSSKVLGNSAGRSGDSGAVRKSDGSVTDPLMDFTNRFSNRAIAAAMGAIAAAMGAIAAANIGAKAASNAGTNHGGGAATLP